MGGKRKAVVLVSGGMDSLVTSAIAVQDFEAAFLHVNYGQRTAERELKSFNDIAGYYAVEQKLVINAGFLKQIGGSSLTDKNMDVSDADLEFKGIPATYVPFRNANLLSMAASWAEAIGAENIFIGAVEEDSSGYPDCREVFYDAFNRAIELGTRPDSGIVVRTPIIHMKKHEIVLKGHELRVPFQLSWSCYRNENKACGVCDSCALRLRGFQTAGLEDPIEYETKPDYSIKNN